MNLLVNKITAEEDLKSAFKIRKEVFVIEQKVDPADEYDEYEETSTHFLALLDGLPVGTARWRLTQKGVKLERFAVLKEARGHGVGQTLVAEVLSDISANNATIGKLKYLHSQLSAVPLYSKFGFEKEGDIFEECNILHYKMKLA
jgi:predicted GNAT family N-acyltransferase